MRFLLAIACLLLSVNAGAKTWYVTPTGVGTGTGVTWANAGNNGDGSFVADSTGSGDTVLFATGTYRQASPLWVVSGTADTDDGRTFYACSSFADTNLNGDYHFVNLWASVAITSWTLVSGSVYKSTTIPSSNYLFIDEQMLQKITSGTPTAGEWRQFASDSIYVRLYDSSDPDGQTVEYSNGNEVIEVGSRDYVTIYGLDIRYGGGASSIKGSSSNTDADYITIERCKVSASAGSAGSNAANIKTTTQSSLNSHWIIRACSLGSAYSLDADDVSWVSYNGGSIKTYSMDSLLIDSCWFYGHHARAVIMFKNDNGLDTYNNVIRYCEIKSEGMGLDGMIVVYRGKNNTWIYGNTFVPTDTTVTGIFLGERNGATGVDSTVHIYNNTFIKVKEPYTDCDGEGGGGWNHFKTIKYNVFYHTTGTDIILAEENLGSPVGKIVIDSNIYFIGDSVWATDLCPGGNYNALTFAEWQAEGWDVNSSVLAATSNDFSGVGAGNYIRPIALDEMDTTYGGKTWTIFGAYQNDCIVRQTDWTQGDGLMTVPSGLDRLLVCSFTYEYDNGLRIVDSVKYGGVNMTLALQDSSLVGNPNYRNYNSLWYLKEANIITGANSFVAYTSGNTSDSEYAYSSYSGVNQVNPIYDTNGFAGTIGSDSFLVHLNFIDGGYAIAVLNSSNTSSQGGGQVPDKRWPTWTGADSVLWWESAANQYNISIADVSLTVMGADSIKAIVDTLINRPILIGVVLAPREDPILAEMTVPTKIIQKAVIRKAYDK